MGAGTPEDLVECVARGIDMFDCVLPTRNARNGQLFTSQGRLNIKNAQLRRGRRTRSIRRAAATPAGIIHGPILRHLYMAGEMTAGALNTLHNLTFYLDTMRTDQGRYSVSDLRYVSGRSSFGRSPAWLSIHEHSVDPFLLAMAAPPRGRVPSRGCSSFRSRWSWRSSISSCCCRCSKRQQKVQEFLAALKVGDRVVTSGGMFGTITRVERSVGPAADRQQRARRSVAHRHRRLPGAGAGRRLRGRSVNDEEPALEADRLIAAVIGLSVWAFYPPGQKVKLGLDLKGGVHLVLRVQTDDALQVETETTVERLRDTLTRAGVQFTKLEVTEPDRVPRRGHLRTMPAFRHGRRRMSDTVTTGRRARAATPTR